MIRLREMAVSAYLRSLIAFLALPGVIAFALPVYLGYSSRHALSASPIGWLVLGIGLAGLVWCARDFQVKGKGTLAPWMPTEQLVINGLYRYTRNPMYVSVTAMLAGWAILFESLALTVYTIVVAIAFHLRVVLGEEPVLAQRYKEQWQEYVRRVPRWFA
jgi:protein-S-isoprenylcysteine O-methyltransferase Ste14